MPLPRRNTMNSEPRPVKQETPSAPEEVSFDFDDSGGFILGDDSSVTAPAEQPSEPDYDARRRAQLGERNGRNPFVDKTSSQHTSPIPTRQQNTAIRKNHSAPPVMAPRQNTQQSTPPQQDVKQPIANAANQETFDDIIAPPQVKTKEKRSHMDLVLVILAVWLLPLAPIAAICVGLATQSLANGIYSAAAMMALMPIIVLVRTIYLLAREKATAAIIAALVFSVLTILSLSGVAVAAGQNQSALGGMFNASSQISSSSLSKDGSSW